MQPVPVGERDPSNNRRRRLTEAGRCLSKGVLRPALATSRLDDEHRRRHSQEKVTDLALPSGVQLSRTTSCIASRKCSIPSRSLTIWSECTACPASGLCALLRRPLRVLSDHVTSSLQRRDPGYSAS